MLLGKVEKAFGWLNNQKGEKKKKNWGQVTVQCKEKFKKIN
jgi:hypothetical protein